MDMDVSDKSFNDEPTEVPFHIYILSFLYGFLIVSYMKLKFKIT